MRECHRVATAAQEDLAMSSKSYPVAAEFRSEARSSGQKCNSAAEQ